MGILLPEHPNTMHRLCKISDPRLLQFYCLMHERRAPDKVFLKKVFLLKIDLATYFRQMQSSYKNLGTFIFSFFYDSVENIIFI